MTNVGSGSLASRPRPARSIQMLANPAPAAPPMSQRRLSPTKTTSDLGTWMTLSACSKSLRDGLTLRLSDENTVVAERLQHGWKGVAACGIVVDDAEGLETREHAVLHDPGRELAPAQGAVGGCEVLLRTKAISTEHERSVHVEQDNSKAGEHAVRDHTRQCRS